MFVNRVILASILMLAAMFSQTSLASALSTPQGKHLEVALRMIGHQVLLQSGDSLTRVMPVSHHKDDYQVSFEDDLAINPDDLVKLVDSVLNRADIRERCILQVKDCEGKEVVYSFELNNRREKSIVPCRSRELPKSCYLLNFSFFNSIEASDEKNEGGRSFWVFFSLAAVMIPVGLVAWKRARSSSADSIIQLGQFHFDQKNATLIFREQRTALTSKEADLLTLLHASENETVKREEILQKVWEDEGDYIGRTLDVYISKLRKRLHADPGIKIVNVRGVGYKLVID